MRRWKSGFSCRGFWSPAVYYLPNPASASLAVLRTLEALRWRALITRQLSYPMARSSSSEEPQREPTSRNSTIRQAALGQGRGVPLVIALVTQRHCCPTVRCSSRGVETDYILIGVLNCTTRRARLGRQRAI